MLGLRRLSIQSKMILLLLAVSQISIFIMAWIGYSTGKAALTQAVRNQLKGVQVAKTTTLKRMLESLRDQVISMSDSRVAIEGFLAFQQAYNQLDQQTLTAEDTARLERFYAEEFLPALAKNIAGQPVLEQYLPTSPAARYLQTQYLAANPHPYEKKQDLDESSTDQSPYGAVHAKFHKAFSRATKIFGFEDLMLVDAKTLDIIYSYQKTTEFGTNLENGPYSTSALGATVRAMRSLRDRDDFRITDFEAYRPSLGKPMGFVSSPIFDGAQMIGILVLQLPIDAFNQVTTGDYQWADEGLGETGECYLVGPDKTMRTRSRFMKTDPERFVQRLRASGVSSKIVDQVERQGNVLGVLPVHSTSVEAALRGQSGIAETIDYRGEQVLSAYGPLELDSLRWASIAEIDLQEANQPIREFGRTVMIVACGMALAVTLLALVCSYWLIRPLRLLTEGARRLGSGETSVQVEITSQDEFGELGKVFNEMSQSLKLQTEKLENQVRENQELLLSILPASAVAQRLEGDEKASRQFTDVSVLFAELLGMEELGGQVGESKALSILGDLIAAFDEVAEKFGIEKVKTIGGSYLAVCGLSVNRPDHARRIIQFAQEVSRIVGVFNRDYKSELSVAIGINSGPVVGGVVGRRKFLYDLWGDTVAIAKKLAAGTGAAIRVTDAVRQRMGEQFQFSGPLRVEVHGKTPIDAWQVTG